MRERDLEPLDTPERKTALKVRLRKLAATIADGDLAQAYKEDLLGRYEQLWPSREPVYSPGAAGRALSQYGWAKRKAVLAGSTPEGRQAATNLTQSARALSAALAIAALHDPSVMDDSIELVGARGFGDQKLDALAHELVQLRYEADAAGFETVMRRLKARGLDDALVERLKRDASRAGVAAPFLAENSRERIHELWRQAFDLLMQLEALERAVETATDDLSRDQDSTTLISLKSERDHLRRLINSDWANPEEELKPVLPH